MTESQAYVAFNLADHVGSVAVAALVERFGSVAKAWEASPGLVSRTGTAIDWEREFETAKRFGVKILTPADADYPERLRGVPQHPLALYVKGDVKALSKGGVAVVGTRRATAYGLDQAARFGEDLVRAGWSVISGLALGIDAAAHKGALMAHGTTVGVIGSGLDRFYPEENRELAREIVRAGGAVVSQFPFGREPDRETFPIRNQVVAALAAGVLAIEAPVKSGTLITTSLAADLGRTVMALPGRVDSPRSAGCLGLIRDGAVLIRDIRDINEALTQLIPPTSKRGGGARAAVDPSANGGGDARVPARTLPRPEVTLEESMILKNVDVDGISLEKLMDLTGFGPGKVGALCMSLRIKGRLRYLPGNRVCLTRA